MEINFGDEFGIGGGGRTREVFKLIIVSVVVARDGFILANVRRRRFFWKWSDCCPAWR